MPAEPVSTTPDFPIKARIDLTRSKPRAMSDHDIVICAINLDRSPERWELLSRQLDESGLPYLRLSAFEGRTLPDEMLAMVDHAGFENCNGRHATPSEIGCYFSHAAAWTVLADRPERYVLVIEDDVRFEHDWLDTLLEALKTHVKPRLLKLSYQRPGVPVLLKRLDKAHRLAVPLTHQACNGAYLIDREAAAKLLTHALPMVLPADHYTESQWISGITTRTIIPALAKQRGIASTQNHVVKFHWSKRLPTFFYRVKSHGRRFFYNLVRSA